MENWNFTSSFWHLHIHFCILCQDFCQLIAIENKRNWNTYHSRKEFFFCLFLFVCCFILLFLLINSALWLSLSVALGFGVGHFLTRCLGSPGNDDAPNESFSSRNLGNCSVLWLMLDFGTVAIIMRKRPWLWLGQRSWNTGKLFLILCIFPLTLRVGDQLHLPKRWTQSLYICVHRQHIDTYIHVQIQNPAVSG